MIRSRRNTANTPSPRQRGLRAKQALVRCSQFANRFVSHVMRSIFTFSAVACAHACALSGLGAFGDRACRQIVRTAKEAQRRRRRLPLDAKGSFIRVVQLATL